MAACAAGLLALRQAWLIAAAARTPAPATAFQAQPTDRRARLLVVGDSTGVGVGVQQAEHSLPGLLAAEFSGLEIVNRCRSGARVRDVLEQVRSAVRSGPPFDVALVLAGGNDVLRLSDPDGLRRDAACVLSALEGEARCVVWMGCADIGSAPAVLPPVSWWLGWRTRRTMALLEQVARRERVAFIDFSGARHTARFARDTATYFAADGLHPSAAAHRYCFVVLAQRLRELGVQTDAWTCEPSTAGCVATRSALGSALRSAPSALGDSRLAGVTGVNGVTER